MNMLEYNPQRVLDYVNMVKKHAKTLGKCSEIVKEYNKCNKLNMYCDTYPITSGETKTIVFNPECISADLIRSKLNMYPDDKKRLEEMAKNILASVKQNEKYSEDMEGLHVEIDHEKGMVLFRPKKITRVSVIMFPKSKYYGKKRNKMINTYHKY